jgi:PTH1 family peptidyl-tRNA hydrolase
MKTCFGTADFWLLRIGIGRPNHDDIYRWVLSEFSAAETEVLPLALETCAGSENFLPEWAKKKAGTAP